MGRLQCSAREATLNYDTIATRERWKTPDGQYPGMQALIRIAADLIVAKENSLYRLSGSSDSEYLCKLRKKTGFAYHSRLLSRMNRYDVFSACHSEGKSYFCINDCLRFFDWDTKSTKTEIAFGRGHGPLQFCEVVGIQGFNNGLYFGEYFGNPQKFPVRIYRKSFGGVWENCFSFGDGEINHVHGMIPDKNRKCIWILTGDFGDGAAIWKAECNFSTVTPVVFGEQKYRSCVGFATANGVLYATDSQLEKNHIFHLEETSVGWRTKALYPINGPAIYGCELADYFVFSTATEPNSTRASKLAAGSLSSRLKAHLADAIDRRPGPGILLNRSEIVVCPKANPQDAFTLYADEKDWLPYRLFQFGCARFPYGRVDDNRLFAYFVGTKSHDGATLYWDLDSLS